MKGNLYSRRKIRFPNFNKLYSLKALLIILFITLIFICVIFFKTAYPVFETTCETSAASHGIKIINEQVSSVMSKYSYTDLITLEKDETGKITFVKADVILINSIVSEIVGKIQSEFDKLPRINVFINMGSVSGISVLKNFKPNFDIELESAGNIDANVKTEFESLGINQTHHKIYLDIDCNIGILTPFSTFGKNVKTEVLLTEAVIVGDVPETYYNLEGFENVEDTYKIIN
jgi:sporulation protein YunB